MAATSTAARLTGAASWGALRGELPHALIGRLVDAVDQLTPADRAAALALHTLGAAGLSAHRDAIAEAARAEGHRGEPQKLAAYRSPLISRA